MSVRIVKSDIGIINQAESEKRLLSNLLIIENAVIFNDKESITINALNPFNLETLQVDSVNADSIAIKANYGNDYSDTVVFEIGELITLTSESYPPGPFTVVSIQDVNGTPSYILKTDYIAGVTATIERQTIKTGHFTKILNDAYYNDIEISNESTATFKHEFYINNLLIFNINGEGGANIQISSDTLSITEIQGIGSCFTGVINNTDGYVIDEDLLKTKLKLFNIIVKEYQRIIKSITQYKSFTGSSKYVLQDNALGVNLNNFSSYEDDTAAENGGLITGDWYYNSTNKGLSRL